MWTFFPCDNLSDCALIRRAQFIASKIVIAKGLYARGYETSSTVRKLFMQGCPLASAEKARRILHTQERYTVAVCPYVFQEQEASMKRTSSPDLTSTVEIG